MLHEFILVFRPQETCLDDFRNAIIQSIKSNDFESKTLDPSFIVVSYDRATLGQTGRYVLQELFYI